MTSHNTNSGFILFEIHVKSQTHLQVVRTGLPGSDSNLGELKGFHRSDTEGALIMAKCNVLIVLC